MEQMLNLECFLNFKIKKNHDFIKQILNEINLLRH